MCYLFVPSALSANLDLMSVDVTQDENFPPDHLSQLLSVGLGKLKNSVDTVLISLQGMVKR